MGLGVIPVRKKGKLPGKTESYAYTLEYGEATVEMQADALQSGDRVVLIDDLLATAARRRRRCSSSPSSAASRWRCCS